MFSPKLISILAVGGALVCAAPAAADNVAYQGTDGNIWISTADGARKKQITTNGTAADPYQRPSQTDDGKILSARQRIFYLHNQDGSVKWAWVAPVAPSLYYNPLGHHISPDSGTIVWWFIKSDGIYDPPTQWLAFHDGNGTATSRCLYNCETGLHDPRWLPGQPYAGAITTDGREVRIQRQGYSDPQPWVAAYDAVKGWGSFQSFDLARAGGNKVLFTVKYGNTTYLESYTLAGPPPNDGLSEVCVSPLGDSNSKVRWSPDGTKITWADAQGVWTGTAPTRGAGGACNIAGKTLIAPGGKDPDFGKADVPLPPNTNPGGGTQNPGGGTQNPGGETQNPGGETQNPGGGTQNPGGETQNPGGTQDPGGTGSQDPGTGGGTGPQDPGTGGGTGPQDPGTPGTPRDTVAPSLAAFKAAGGKLGTRYAVTFIPSENGTATLQIVQGKTVVAAAKANVKAGAKVKLTAKFTKKLKKAKKVKLAVRLIVTDAAGNQTTRTAKVTLKK